MASCSDSSCPHLIFLPVETDESMTSWPICQECSLRVNVITAPGDDITVNDRSRGLTAPPLATPTDPSESRLPALHHPLGRDVRRPPEYESCESNVAVFPGAQRRWNVPSEDEESLELPLPLRSDVGETPHQSARLGMKRSHLQCPRCPPPPARSMHLHAGLNPVVPVVTPQPTTRARDTPEVMSEVCVLPSQPIRTGRSPAQEVRRTISLPEDCRTVFITYSVDVAEEMFPFVKFLISQGFKPAIDIFDNAVRQMDFNKWMDGYLQNKSVLIIMVISPKYKTDIEGDGSDQHGLHTKYIHSQLQNEFIQQRCLNFRVVPVLFPIANRSHVPLWLQSTCVFRWPHDAQDLLLRLLREERYIPPPRRGDPTISIRPV